MNETISLHFSVQPEELTRFCEKLLKRSRDISKTHDALSTLQAFVTHFSKTANHPDAYQAIDAVLKSYTEKTRKSLLDEKTLELIKALKQLDRNSLSNIHHCLSRNGFYQILQVALSHLSSSQVNSSRNWCNKWVEDAKQAAELASGYPDAFDFNKAGIDIKEFQAMKDVSHFMNSSC